MRALPTRARLFNLRPPALYLGSFNIDEGNGSENVSVKMNSRFFNLCGVYSNFLKMASIGEFRWS